jgi:hypothetical protein
MLVYGSELGSANILIIKFTTAIYDTRPFRASKKDRGLKLERNPMSIIHF